jgi:WXG100 family type VII secretion target
MAQYGSIKIDTSTMRSTAKILENQRTIIGNISHDIFREAQTLKGCWEGDTASKYQEIIRKAQGTDIVGILAGYCDKLEEIAQSFDATEKKIANMNFALPNVFDT